MTLRSASLAVRASVMLATAAPSMAGPAPPHLLSDDRAACPQVESAPEERDVELSRCLLENANFARAPIDERETDCRSCTARGSGAAPVRTQIATALPPPNGPADDWDGFGYSVATDGVFIYVGALGDEQAGRVYVYEEVAGEWSLRDLVSPPRDEPGLGFGASVAVLGEVLLVGATGAGSYTGTAFVYRQGGSGDWVFETELAASDGVPNDFYGNAVALGPDRAFVGAHLHGRGSSSASYGAVYVFARDAAGIWSEEVELSPAELNAWDSRFGTSVAFDGDTLLVGAAFHGEVGGAFSQSGSVFVFELGDAGWAAAGKLLPAALGSGDLLGWSVALEGNLALIGAPGRNSATGEVFAFARDMGGAWSEVASPAPLALPPAVNFGRAVTLDGGRAVVGAAEAWFSDPPPTVLGFVRQPDGGWSETFRLSADDSLPFASFGVEVAARDGLVTIGAPIAYRLGQFSGDAFADRFADLEAAIPAPLPRDPGAVWDFFGISVAQSGPFTLVGAAGDDADRPEGGAVYVLEESPVGWQVTARLPAPAGVFGFNGVALDVDGEWVLSGEVGLDPDTGEQSPRASLYRRSADAWDLETTLVPTGPLRISSNGPAAVAIAGELAAIGAPSYFAGSEPSVVHVFRRLDGEWRHSTDLLSPFGDDDLGFGHDLSLVGSQLLVGGWFGRAFLYERRGAGDWELVATMESPSAPGGWSPASVALGDSDFAIVGSPGSEPSTVTVFEPDALGAWMPVATLQPSVPALQLLGVSIALQGERLLVGGSSAIDDPGPVPVATLFRRNDDRTWSEIATLAVSDPDVLSGAARAVSLRGHRAVVGDRYARTERGFWSGIAHLFEANTPPRSRLDRFSVDESGTHATSAAASASFNVLVNDQDDEGDLLSAMPLSGVALPDGWWMLPSGARYRLLADGALLWDSLGAWDHLVEGQTAVEEILHEVHDGFGGVTEGTVLLEVRGAGINLELDKQVSPQGPAIGEVVTFTLAVSNTGPTTETNVVVTDPLPSALEWVSSPCATFGSGLVTWSLPSLVAARTETCVFQARALEIGPLVNVARASSDATTAVAEAQVELGVTAMPIPTSPVALATLALLLTLFAFRSMAGRT